MFIVTLFIMAKKWKEPRCPSTDEWINKMGHIHTMGYYLAMKKNKPLIHATIIDQSSQHAKWKKPPTKGLILYGSTYMKCLVCKSMETENQLVVARGWDKGKGGMTVNGYDTGLLLWKCF